MQREGWVTVGTPIARGLPYWRHYRIRLLSRKRKRGKRRRKLGEKIAGSPRSAEEKAAGRSALVAPLRA